MSDGGTPAPGLPITHVPAAAGTARDHDHDAAPTPDEQGPPAFFFDFGEPEAYLAAERVLQTLPVATPWVPIDSSRLPGSTWGGFRCAEDEAAARERLEHELRVISGSVTVNELDERADAAGAAATVRALMFVTRFRQDLERRLDALDTTR